MFLLSIWESLATGNFSMSQKSTSWRGPSHRDRQARGTPIVSIAKVGKLSRPLQYPIDRMSQEVSKWFVSGL